MTVGENVYQQLIIMIIVKSSFIIYDFDMYADKSVRVVRYHTQLDSEMRKKIANFYLSNEHISSSNIQPSSVLIFPFRLNHYDDGSAKRLRS